MGIIDICKTKVPLPQYDEIELFFINLTIVTLFIVDPLFRQDFFGLIPLIDPRIFIVIFLGFLYTIYHSLFIEKNNLGKTVMGIYIIFLNLFVGFKGIYLLKDSIPLDYNIIFPVINVLISVVLLAAMRGDFFHPEEVISNRQARRKEIILGIIFIPAMVIASQYLFKNNWIITFSVCLFYFGLIHSFFTKLIFGEQEITEMDFILDNDQNKKSKLIAKIVLATIFITGMVSYFVYLKVLENHKKEERQRTSEESATRAADFRRRMGEDVDGANEVYYVSFGMPRYVYQEKDPSTLFNDGKDKNEGDVIKVKGVVKDWISEKFIQGFASEEIKQLAVNKNLRLGFYEMKPGYYTNNRYYVLCDSLYSAHVGEIVEVDGVISTYNIYRDDNLKEVVSKCIKPNIEVKIIDKE